MAVVLIFSFCVCGVLVWSWYQNSAGLVKCVWKLSFPFSVLEELEKYKY